MNHNRFTTAVSRPQFEPPRSVAFFLAGLMIFVALVSWFIFLRQSLRLDEAQSLWQTSHNPAKILNILAQDVHLPLYHLILHYWTLYLGNSVAIARALSLIFFLLSIPALYALGRRLFNWRISLFATVIFSISPFMNWYGNEVRMYSLLTLATILSQYFFVRIYQDRDGDSWFGYFVVALAGIFIHYFFFFVLLVQALFFLTHQDLFPPKSLRRFIAIAAVIVLVFSPWLWYVRTLGTVSNEVPLLATPNTVNVFNTFSEFLFGFQNDHLNTVLVSLWPISVLLGFLALRHNKRVSPEVVYIMMSILIPIAAAFTVSVTVRPLFVSRYLILTIPSMYLLIGWVFSTYPQTLGRFFRTLLIIIMFAGLAVESANPNTPVKENYESAARFLEANAAPQDIIILSAPFTVYPVEYYYRGATEISTLPIWNRFVTGPIPAFDEATLPDEVAALKDRHDKAYLLLSYDQGYEEKIRLYFDSNFHRLDVKNFSPGLNLYVYQLRYDVPILQYVISRP